MKIVELLHLDSDNAGVWVGGGGGGMWEFYSFQAILLKT